MLILLQLISDTETSSHFKVKELKWDIVLTNRLVVHLFSVMGMPVMLINQNLNPILSKQVQPYL